ncbi:MAG TPA: prepilin-type N-terminal cleavage/methylation domain-containing protein [Caldimonas sp.]
MPNFPSRRAARGFTLIELILVIVVGSVMAATLVVFFRPAVDGYLASRARADLTDQADTALRRITRDVRMAVPNSVRTPGSQCFEVVPSSGGGRFRSGPDSVNDSGPNCTPGTSCSASLDSAQATAVFDVLTPLVSTPAVGDWVVVGNQNPADVYGGVNRAAIASVAVPAAAYGRHRITVASTQFPLGYDGARFTLVPNAQQAVFYVCSGADGTLDASGNGRGTLYRLASYGFNAAYPVTCPAVASADVLATRVRTCSFVYDPNQGATQQSGFVWMEIELARNGEKAHLAMGAHVANGP